MDKYKNIEAPAFVLEESRFRSNLELIQKVKKAADIEIILALKGFSMWSAFPIMKEYGIKTATASSLHEARLTYEEFAAKAHTYAPVYSPKEFEELMDYSSHITFNSLSQFNRFYPKIKESKKPISCGLRLNPEYSVVETELYNPCAPGSRLGIAADNLKDGIPDGVEGLHFHNLCESNSYDLEKTIEQVEKLYGHLLPSLKWINMGGGHLMTKKGYDLEHLVKILKAFKAKYDFQIILEPGSAFAWDCGPLIANVLDVVDNNGVKTLMLDVSFTAHMPDTLEMPYRPVIIGAVDAKEGLFNYRIGGTSCLAGDYMLEYGFENSVEIGSRIIFQDMIHYTMVKTNMFNGVQHPNIGILKENGKFELIRKFNYDDFKYRLS